MIKRIIATVCILAAILSLVGCAGLNNGINGAGTAKYAPEEYRTTMQYYDDFKVLQLADLHLGIETDLAHQLGIVKDTIRAERPDLIILTGDNFMYATKDVVKTLVSTLNEECKSLTASRRGRLSKFTMTFGNHDNQGDYPRYFVNDVMASYATADGCEIADGKYAAFIDYEDDNLFGLTNFFIDLVDDRQKSRDKVDVKYRLHIIDSNTYHFSGTDYDYDVIHDEQLDHVKDIYDSATADKNYVGMAFFHIPLYEYQDAYNEYLSAPDKSIVGQGEFLEKVLPPYKNNGSYERLRSANIISFISGHNHKNYGDFIFHADRDISERALFSFGVKSSNQLYHSKDMIGYKTITLRDVSAAEFISIENVKESFKNFTGGYTNYEK